MTTKRTTEKKGEGITKAKSKRVVYGNLNGSAINKRHRNLAVTCSEMSASF